MLPVGGVLPDRQRKAVARGDTTYVAGCLFQALTDQRRALSRLLLDCRVPQPASLFKKGKPAEGEPFAEPAVATKKTPVESILAHSGEVIADKGYQGCGYVTPRKKPKRGELSVGDKRENKNVSRLRTPVERSIARLKAWRILHTDYRRPLTTYLTSFRAAIGLFFFQAET